MMKLRQLRAQQVKLLTGMLSRPTVNTQFLSKRNVALKAVAFLIEERSV